MEQNQPTLTSLKLSKALGDIGINKHIINRRRNTCLVRETLQTLREDLTGSNADIHYFGSQSEGSTTAGMESDIDLAKCLLGYPVILDMSEWQKGKRHLLVLWTQGTQATPPQHCRLQKIFFKSVKCEIQIGDVVEEDKVILSNLQYETHEYLSQLSKTGKVIIHGPSRTFHEDYDQVINFNCARLPDECQVLFQRPRPGHWPKEETLKKMRKAGVYLIPQGFHEHPSISKEVPKGLQVPFTNPAYPPSKLQWRFSTSKMERYLVFDFNEVQMKTYVALKLLRKTKKKEEEEEMDRKMEGKTEKEKEEAKMKLLGDRFSTFHLKTAMMFTIESYPPDIWREENLVQCMKYCLTTLLRWLRIKYCPHYTIANVNLFTGKLYKHELISVSATLSSMINDGFQYIYQIKMDNLGQRLAGSYNSGRSVDMAVSYMLNTYTSACCACYEAVLLNLPQCNSEARYKLFQMLKKLKKTVNEKNPDTIREAVDTLRPFLCNTLASIGASMHIANEDFRIAGDDEDDKRYEASFESDLLSSRLKYASMLYCSKKYYRAEEMLTECEKLMTECKPLLWQVCHCPSKHHMNPTTELIKLAANSKNTEIMKRHAAVCVYFTGHEIHCIPQHLVYEMFRTIGPEDKNDRQSMKNDWMDFTMVDCIPFLYYLQFLTYKELAATDQQESALEKLFNYKANGKQKDVLLHGHKETVFNMLGHCYEMKREANLAMIYYAESLKMQARNNAANWHMILLLFKVYMSLK